MLRTRTRRYLRSVFEWHRYAGLTAFLIVLMLAVTGVLLNHTERLALDEVYVKSELVLDWYGVRAPDIDGAFNTASHWIVEIEDQLYMDRRALEPPATGMRGAV